MSKRESHLCIDTIVEALYKVVEALCVVLLFVDVIVIGYVVFGRFILNKTPKWGEEFSLLCMIWLSVLSASLAIKDDRHIRLTFVDRLFGKYGQIIRNTIFHVLNLVFSVVLFVEGIKIIKLVKGSVMPGSGLPQGLLYLSVPVSTIVFILMQIFVFYKEVRSWRTTK